MTVWLFVRLAVILVVVIIGWFAPLRPHAWLQIGWVTLLVVFSVCVVGVPLLLGLRGLRPLEAKMRSRPSWTSNPLNLRDPIQFFHLGACLSIAQGLIGLVRMVLKSQPFYVEALIPLALGAGILLGIKISLGLFTFTLASSDSGNSKGNGTA
jgi:hypothetical protein